MRPILLPVPHVQQRESADCLAACAAMVLTYRGGRFRYTRLVKLLDIKWFGTPFSQLNKLTKLGVSVEIAHGTIDTLYTALQADHPIIVPVQAGELPYHDTLTDHSIVVVGKDDGYVYVHDPMFSVGAIPVPQGDFELAWLAHDEKFAIISQL